jgi:16S rRNA (cytosine967-C5)-methyltransferase
VAKSSGDRQRSARLLIRVEEGAFASRLLERETSPGVRARVMGVLRWQRSLDHLLKPFLKRPIARLDPEVRAALRMGCFEMHHLGVPAPVATDSMIRLTRRMGKSSAAGMVNAILRRAAVGELSAIPDIRWSHPEWLWRRWSEFLGAESVEAAMAAATEPAPPWVWFAHNRPSSVLEDGGVVLEPHPWCPETWTAVEGRPELMKQVQQGGVVVQDPSSQMVARIAVGAADDSGRAADICAAPGGKTALLRKLGSWDLLVAGDVSLAKAVRLGNRLGEMSVVVGDAGRPALSPGVWDLVLLDAPCSGTGTFRRHPELKWRLTLESIAEAARHQRPMIAGALDLLAPGGILVYATCSVEPEENEAHFEQLAAGFERVPMDDHLPVGMPWSETTAGGVRILPHEHGDGFTVHALRRRC